MSRWRTGSLGPEVFEQLAEGLAGTALQSMLLEVTRRRAGARTPADVLAQYRRDRFTGAENADSPCTPVYRSRRTRPAECR